jgi:hypothetical protein
MSYKTRYDELLATYPLRMIESVKPFGADNKPTGDAPKEVIHWTTELALRGLGWPSPESSFEFQHYFHEEQLLHSERTLSGTARVRVTIAPTTRYSRVVEVRASISVRGGPVGKWSVEIDRGAPITLTDDTASLVADGFFYSLKKPLA